MPEFTSVMPHGDIEEMFPDIFFVTGTTRPDFMGQTWQFSRNMTVVRDGQALTLINTVRLNDSGLEALDGLGSVTNVVKLGSFHGIDDPFYIARYDAKLWALPGMEHENGLVTDYELAVGNVMPFSNCSLFVFETSVKPEGVLHLDREGGILISCDSLQNWREPDRFFSEESSAKMREIGFFQPANVGPGWRQACDPQASDFARLKQLTFSHLLSAHGGPLRDTAYEELSATFQRIFKI